MHDLVHILTVGAHLNQKTNLIGCLFISNQSSLSNVRQLSDSDTMPHTSHMARYFKMATVLWQDGFYCEIFLQNAENYWFWQLFCRNILRGVLVAASAVLVFLSRSLGGIFWPKMLSEHVSFDLGLGGRGLWLLLRRSTLCTQACTEACL